MPTDYKKYPDNWLTEIRPHILKRSEIDGKECCEWCKAENNRHVWYHPSADSEPAMMHIWTQDKFNAAKWYGNSEIYGDYEPLYGYMVCLTIAHLADPSPMNCEDDNLAALCQTCHLRYDAKMKANNIKADKIARQEKAGQLSMFEWSE